MRRAKEEQKTNANDFDESVRRLFIENVASLIDRTREELVPKSEEEKEERENPNIDTGQFVDIERVLHSLTTNHHEKLNKNIKSECIDFINEYCKDLTAKTKLLYIEEIVRLINQGIHYQVSPDRLLEPNPSKQSREYVGRAVDQGIKNINLKIKDFMTRFENDAKKKRRGKGSVPL